MRRACCKFSPAERLKAVCLGLVATCSWMVGCASAESSPASLCQLIVETSMPHLEENLRYATTTSTQCLTEQELFVAFPVLQQESLSACTLVQQERREHEASYRLVCPASSGTTGTAVWHLGGTHAVGTLRVKLGGKNMTFSQRVTAELAGHCEKAHSASF